MKTSLKYILARNASNLKKFIEQNEIYTYEDLVRVCDERKFIPVSKEEYDLLEAKKGEQKKENEAPRKTVIKKQPAKTVKKKQPAKTRTTRRRSSSSQKKQSSSSSSKKVKNT